jgi:hypothetical protein
MPEEFDPFGYTKKLEEITTDLAVLSRKVDALMTQNAAILAAVNKPAWLTPAVPAAATDAAITITFSPIIDVGGQIYTKLDAISAGESTIEGLLAALPQAILKLLQQPVAVGLDPNNTATEKRTTPLPTKPGP